MIFDRIDRGLMPWHVVAFVIIAVVLGGILAFVTGPHLSDAIAAGHATEVAADPALGAEPPMLLEMYYVGFEEHEVTEVLAALGEDGQSYYATSHLIADLFFVPALFLALTSVFLWLSRPGRRFAVPLPEGVRLVVVALAGAGFAADWIENICLWVILGAEDPSSGLIALAGTVTSVKWLAYSAAGAAVLATIILALIRGVSSQEPVRT